MKRSSLLCLVTVFALLLAGCATPSSPNASAEAQCSYLARGEGLTLRQVDGVASNVNGVIALNVRVEDALGRRINTVCNYNTTTKAASWAQPLPAGIRRS